MKKIFCWGTFDILHEGSLEFLKDARSKGDYLYILVVSDEAVYKNKGKYPVNTQQKRIETIKKLKMVDEVIPGNKIEQNLELILSIKPNIVVFGYDQNTIYEEKLKEYLLKNNLNPKYYISKEFARGIHASRLRF